MMSLNINPRQTQVRHRGTTPCILQHANNNRNHGRFNDVTIQSSDTSIRANRMVLSCYCSYFDQLFQSQTTDQIRSSDIDLREVDGKPLELIIDFIYTGQICIDSDNVLNILSTADQLEMDEVKQFCFEFLQDCITPDNCIAILITAKQYRNFTLRDKVYQHISDNYQTMTQTPAFLELDNFELFFIVYHLKTRFSINHEALCQSLLSWTKHDEENRTEPLHRYIRFVNVDELSFDAVKDLLNESLIQQNDDFETRLRLRFQELNMKKSVVTLEGFHTNRSVKTVYKLTDCLDVYPDLPVPLIAHTSLLLNNRIYCVGGYNDVVLNNVYKLNLNPNDLTWEEIAFLGTKRCYFGAAVFNDALVVCGGNDGDELLSSVECYEPEQNQWSEIFKLKSVRYGNQSVSSNGYLYTIGGSTTGIDALTTVERLDGLDQNWKSVSSMQISRSWFAAVECDKVIYAIGGQDNELRALNSVERYDCEADRWTFVNKLNIERYSHCACTLQGKIYVVGGWNGNNETVKEIECYNPGTNHWEIIESVDDRFRDHSLVAA